MTSRYRDELHDFVRDLGAAEVLKTLARICRHESNAINNEDWKLADSWIMRARILERIASEPPFVEPRQ